MEELTIKQFSDLTYNKLSELEEEVSLSDPTIGSTFPCRIISTPIEVVQKTDRKGVNLLKQFQISISHFGISSNECMEMVSQTDNKLSEYKFVKTNTLQIKYDKETEKYNLVTTYEVCWNALVKSFMSVK